MEITIRTVKDITVVDISGSLDTHTSGPASDEMIRIVRGSNKVLVNLENLEYLSSAGIRVLLRAFKKLNESGGKMKICNATGTAKIVLEISCLDKFFNLYHSETDALAAF